MSTEAMEAADAASAAAATAAGCLRSAYRRSLFFDIAKGTGISLLAFYWFIYI